MALSAALRRVDFADLPGWDTDDHAAAFEAFRRCAHHAAVRPYRSGALGIDSAAFQSAYEAARRSGALGPDESRAFFEHHFRPFAVAPGGKAGFVTGYYEPIVAASTERTSTFTFPLLARPDDLVDLDDRNRPADMDPSFAFGRSVSGAIVEYHDRAAIERGAVDHRVLALAWLSDPVDLFFIHVQGAARLVFGDGTTRRFTYAAKSGHPFTGPGRVLAGLGEIAPEDVTMQSIRAWFRANPGRIDEILWQNRSYIFFREAPVADPDLGPIAAAKVPLTPGRSLAVDRLLHTFGTPVHVDAPQLAVDGRPFRRLMIAQDTGSAIVGAARGDLFFGSGDEAGEIAGTVRYPAGFYALVPNTLAGRAQ
ncbi:murein transglycosylase A [Mesorhizobium xinjiangense]|uniref:murein transglycosylase A n=1 Tax=Mesorhizobium xinjiangense TaxID=2678685 RepID=UPI0012EE3FE6|nr:murein transglycosylase A [Mesorhizobium xinjiangense]